MKKRKYILAFSSDGSDTMALAPMAFTDSGRTPPDEFLLIRYGDNEYTKGEERGKFTFGEADADEIISDFSQRGKDIVFDYEHQTLKGVEAPASGWIRSIAKGAEGLVVKVDWTDRARKFLEGREYRYHSPVLYFNKEGRPHRLHSAALTNHPALHGYPALVANDDKQNKEKAMNEHLKKIAELLGVAVVALADGKEDEKATAEAVKAKLGEMQAAQTAAQAEKAAVAELLQLHDCKTVEALGVKIAGMVPSGDKAALEMKLAKIEAEKAVAKAFTDGKLVEAQREWAVKLAEKDLAAFNDFAAKAPKVTPGKLDPKDLGNPPRSSDGAQAFTDAEMQVFKTLNLTDEQIEKIKKEK
jgi:phage I-like protein